MAFLPRSMVSKNIKKRVKDGPDGVRRESYEAYFGTDAMTGKPVRVSRSTMQELKLEISAFYARLNGGGESAARLTPLQAYDAKMAIDFLAANGRSESLLQVAEMFVGGKFSVVNDGGTKLSNAIQKFLASISGKSDGYRKSMTSRLGLLMADIGADKPLGEIDAPSVKESLMGRLYRVDDPKSWRTYNNHLGDINTFMNWCASPEQALVGSNPIACMKKIEIPYHDPKYMKADDVAALFACLWKHVDSHPYDLAHAVLSFFCGMRQAEIDRVREGDDAVKIDVENGFVRIVKGKGQTRGIRPRAFTIPEPALSWMKAFDFVDAAKTWNPKFRRHLVERAAEAGIEMPGNAGRHTFITMYAAAYHDQAKLTSIVGNTEGVRARSYDGIEIEKEGRQYFSIMPPTDNAVSEAK